jgi:hypothetical protein
MENTTSPFAPKITISGLSIAILPGIMYAGGVLTFNNQQQVNLASNATTWVFFNTATGAIATNLTGFPTTNCYPLAKVVTGLNGINSLTESRPDLFLPTSGTSFNLSGTVALGTSLITSGAKATTVTVSAPGVLSTDNVLADFNADPTGVTGYVPSANGMLTIIKFPTTDNVNFIVVNNTGGSITPGAITLNWKVIR